MRLHCVYHCKVSEMTAVEKCSIGIVLRWVLLRVFIAELISKLSSLLLA